MFYCRVIFEVYLSFVYEYRERAYSKDAVYEQEHGM